MKINNLMAEGLINYLDRFRSHGFMFDIVTLLNGRIISLVIGIVANIIVARVLGPSDKGILATIMVVPGIAYSLADLGIRQATTYYVGKQIYDDQSVILTINYLSIFTSFLMGFIIFIIYLLTGIIDRYGYGITIIALAMIPFHLNRTYASGVLLGKKNIRVTAISTMLQPAVYVLLLIPLYFLPEEFRLKGALLATLISTALGAAYVLFKIRAYGRLGARYIAGLPWAFIRKGFVYALALFTLSLHYRIDILILEHVSTTEEVGVYSVGVSWAQLLWLLPGVIGTINFSYSAGIGDTYKHTLRTAKLMRVTLYGGAIPCLGLFFTSRWLIPLVYGEAYMKSGMVVQALMLGIWISLVFKILNSDLAGRGKPNAALWVYGIALAMNVALNLWLAPKYGALGASWASSVTYTFGAAVYALVYSKISNIPIYELLRPRKKDWENIFSRSRMSE